MYSRSFAMAASRVRPDQPALAIFHFLVLFDFSHFQLFFIRHFFALSLSSLLIFNFLFSSAAFVPASFSFQFFVSVLSFGNNLFRFLLVPTNYHFGACAASR
jgi:hypothetical protein